MPTKQEVGFVDGRVGIQWIYTTRVYVRMSSISSCPGEHEVYVLRRAEMNSARLRARVRVKVRVKVMVKARVK